MGRVWIVLGGLLFHCLVFWGMCWGKGVVGDGSQEEITGVSRNFGFSGPDGYQPGRGQFLPLRLLWELFGVPQQSSVMLDFGFSGVGCFVISGLSTRSPIRSLQ